MVALLPAVALVTFALSGCNGQDAPTPDFASSTLPDTSAADPSNPPVDKAPAPAPEPPSYTTDVLLFNGTGVSTSDWQSTEQILKSQGLSYRLVNSAQLNAMSLDQIASFGVIVVPGGSGGTMQSTPFSSLPTSRPDSSCFSLSV